MPLNLTPGQTAELRELRKRWFEVIRPLAGLGASSFLEPVPEFTGAHLRDARILSRREDVFDHLPKGGRIAELGTQEGYFARKLHDALAPEELHLFDIDFAPFHARKALPADTPGLVLHQGDSSTELSRFPDGHFDVIYIDGDHSYEGVKRDAEVARRKIKPDGTLWFNDFTLWSPVEMIDYGTPYVVSELCHSGRWKIAFLTLHPLFYNDVVLTPA